MIPGRIEGAESVLDPPENWEKDRAGECQRLPIRVTRHAGYIWQQSAWMPSPQEIAAIQRGAPVILSISAPVHPVVAVNVGAVPGAGDPVPGLEYVRADMPIAAQIEIWDDDLGQPVARPVYEAHLRDGWIKVSRLDHMNRPAFDRFGAPIYDKLHGRFSARQK